jgi:hypothetical protein
VQAGARGGERQGFLPAARFDDREADEAEDFARQRPHVGRVVDHEDRLLGHERIPRGGT